MASPVSCDQPALTCLCSAHPSWSIPAGIGLSEASSRGTSVQTPGQNIQIHPAQYSVLQQERPTGANALTQCKMWQNRTDVQGEAVCKLTAEAGGKKASSRVSKALIAEFLLKLTTGTEQHLLPGLWRTPD